MLKKIWQSVKAAYAAESRKDIPAAKEKVDLTVKITATIMLGVAAVILTLMNIASHYWFMMFTAAILSVGFFACAYIFAKTKLRTLGVALMTMLVGFIFTICALTGENEVYAILWILIVPPIALNVIGMRVGTGLCAYFLVFTVALFNTPMKEYVGDAYTTTFIQRFPLLFLVSFFISLILTAQKEYYYTATEHLAYVDVMTGLGNRSYYELLKNHIREHGIPDDLAIVSIDINRLKYHNDMLGHEAGDLLITGTAACIKESFDTLDGVCRVGGDEFIIIMYGQPEEIEDQITSFDKSMKNYQTKYFRGIAASVGYATRREFPDDDIDIIERNADERMYASKRDFYISNALDRRKS